MKAIIVSKVNHLDAVRAAVLANGQTYFKGRTIETKTKGTRVVLERIKLLASTEHALKSYAQANGGTYHAPIAKDEDGRYTTRNVTMVFS